MGEKIFTFSTGGEGCIIAAAGSVMGVGSDIGGSIRMPAFVNGIYGHKPATGQSKILSFSYFIAIYLLQLKY